MSIGHQAEWRQADAGLVTRAGLSAALLGAAVVHATVVADHYEEWRLAGLFFIALMLVESLLAVAVVVGLRRLVAALVVATSLGTLVVWAVSRTYGLPFGPTGFRTPEDVGIPDLACVVLEVATVLLALPWMLSRRGVGTGPRGRASLLLSAAAVLVAAAVTAWGVAPALSGERDQVPTHGHHHHHAG